MSTDYEYLRLTISSNQPGAPSVSLSLIFSGTSVHASGTVNYPGAAQPDYTDPLPPTVVTLSGTCMLENGVPTYLNLTGVTIVPDTDPPQPSVPSAVGLLNATLHTDGSKVTGSASFVAQVPTEQSVSDASLAGTWGYPEQGG